MSFVESELQSSFCSTLGFRLRQLSGDVVGFETLFGHFCIGMVLLVQSLYECNHACLSFASALRGSTHIKLSLTSAAMNDLRDELGEGPQRKKEISTPSSLLSIASWHGDFALLVFGSSSWCKHTAQLEDPKTSKAKSPCHDAIDSNDEGVEISFFL